MRQPTDQDPANHPGEREGGSAESPPAPASRPRAALPTTTRVLVAALILAAGFVGGVTVSKATGGSPGNAPVVRTRGDGPGAADGATVGTVQKVVGDTVYIKTPEGKTVKVTTDDQTQVHVTKPGTVNDLASGSTVIVHGDDKGDGSVAAQAIDQANRVDRHASKSPTP